MYRMRFRSGKVSCGRSYPASKLRENQNQLGREVRERERRGETEKRERQRERHREKETERETDKETEI